MNAGAELADATARRRIGEDLDATLFVEAAAGTGKTTALVGRIVALVRSGKGTLERIVAVTFTEKAAGEMKLRLRTELEQARVSADTSGTERERLEEALSQLELARINTIHAFCGDLLHERPVEAGVDPVFAVAPEDESARMLEQAFDAWFQRALSDPPEGVRRVLRRRPAGFKAPGPREQLKTAAATLIGHRDFTCPWGRGDFDRDAAIDAIMARLAGLGALAEAASWKDDFLCQNLGEVGRFVIETRQIEGVRGRDHDGLEASLRELKRHKSWRWKGSYRTQYGELPQKEVLARRDAVKADLEALLDASDADLAPLLRDELQPVVRGYEELKHQAGRLDFLDLLVKARDLIRDNPSVREGLQQRFTHYFVDEFQDTDPLQAEMLLLLAADDAAVSDWRTIRPVPGKLFVVGDPKQSIYRFRRADVAIYESVKRQLTAVGAEVLHLTTSFRSVPPLQDFVNAAFAPAMRAHGRGTQAEYVALEPFRAPLPAQPAIVALPVPRPYTDFGKIYNWPIEKSLPDAVGAYVHWLVMKSGWKVYDKRRGDEPVPIQPQHVCILFRRFKSFYDDVTRPYVRALETRRVPHVLVGGKSFHDREEILAIRNALNAIEWPDDELSVYATMRGPLFAIGDDALLAWRSNLGRLYPFSIPDPDTLDGSDRDVADALGLLAGLHRSRNRRPIAETLSRLLEAVRAHAGIAIWPTGEQSLANALRMIDIARRFERRGAPSFRAFVERMDEEAERGDAEDAPMVEEGTEGVRIMTVHKAKGLEFPVVVLADPTCRAVRDRPSRHVDPDKGLWAEPLCGCAPQELNDAAAEELRRDAEEAVRLAYVAATRARDLLVVPVVGDQEVEGWLAAMNAAVYPPPKVRRDGGEAPGCPSFGDDSVYEWPESAARDANKSVRPGLHRIHDTAGVQTHEVVWWDPHEIELDLDERVGVRQTRILEADEDGGQAEESVRAHDAWLARRGAALERGAQPTLSVRTVTALAAAGNAEKGFDVALERVSPADRGRPGGKRFGTLVHAVLAMIDLDAGESDVHAMARAQGRLIGASDDEVGAAVGAAIAVLASPLMRRAARAAAAGNLRRETPVLQQRADGTLAEGTVDLAFRDSEDGTTPAWTVIDFKTDREIEARQETYLSQVALYAEAVSRATNEPARGVLLLV